MFRIATLSSSLNLAAYFPIGLLCIFVWQAWQLYPAAHTAFLPHTLPRLHVLPPLLAAPLSAGLPEVWVAQKDKRPNKQKSALSLSHIRQQPFSKLRPTIASTESKAAPNLTSDAIPSSEPTPLPPTQQAPLPLTVPNPSHALLAQGQAYQQHGQWAAARRVQQQAWQIQPSARLAWQLALSHDQLGTRGEAKYFYRQALPPHFAHAPLTPNEQATVVARLQQLGG